MEHMISWDQQDFNRARVREAAQALDKVKPGWAGKIDTATLDLRSIHDCVLAQSFRVTWWPRSWQLNFSRGLDILRRKAKFHPYPGVFASNEPFLQYWLDEIAARPVEAPAPRFARLRSAFASLYVALP